MNETIEIQYRLIQGRYTKVTWTHKIQECQGDIYLKKARIVKRHITWFSVLTTGSALSSIFPWVQDTVLLSSITAFLALCLSYFTIRFADGYLENKASQNKSFAAEMHDLRNKYESLLADIKSNHLTAEDVISRRNSLREEEHILYKDAPNTTPKAVKAANKALKINKDSTTEGSEVEAILPDFLKL